VDAAVGVVEKEETSVLAPPCTLRFFNYRPLQTPVQPRTISDVLNVVTAVRAGGATSMAAGLWPFYAQQKAVKFMVLVPDEEENVSFGFKGQERMFIDTLRAYHAEVAPNVHLVLLSFVQESVAGPWAAQIRKELGMPVTQFVLNQRAPDLRKLDELLAVLAANTERFAERVKRLKIRLHNERHALTRHERTKLLKHEGEAATEVDEAEDEDAGEVEVNEATLEADSSANGESVPKPEREPVRSMPGGLSHYLQVRVMVMLDRTCLLRAAAACRAWRELLTTPALLESVYSNLGEET
jgi:hypothetical protein